MDTIKEFCELRGSVCAIFMRSKHRVLAHA
jgi:hypothetical protein